MNIGHSSKLQYDKCYYPESLSESVSPGDYRLQEYSTYNCNSCVAPIGVQFGFNGAGVGTAQKFSPAMAQKLVDVESNLSNRNLQQSRCRSGRVNLTDVSKLQLNELQNCNGNLSPEYSHFTSSPKGFKDVQINRFYNLKKNPQEPIFYDFAINTTLEAKDNFRPVGPRVLRQGGFPEEDCRKQPYTLKCLSIPERQL